MAVSGLSKRWFVFLVFVCLKGRGASWLVVFFGVFEICMFFFVDSPCSILSIFSNHEYELCGSYSVFPHIYCLLGDICKLNTEATERFHLILKMSPSLRMKVLGGLDLGISVDAECPSA